MHDSSPTFDRHLPSTSEPENLALSRNGSTSGSDNQISPAPTNSTLVVSPNGNLTPPLTEPAFPVEVKRLGSEAESITSVTPTVDGQTAPVPKSSLFHEVKAAQAHESEDPQDQKRFNIQWSSPNPDAQPGIYWFYPATMILLALGGFFGAIGHHLYNRGLSGKEAVGNADWPQRWGIALAFFIKMMLGAAVQVAFKQIAWLTVKKRAFKVKTLDSIFHACYDPAEFFDKDLISGAYMPALLAGLIWLLPLSAIATPSTLTLRDGINNYTGSCNVSHLDFTLENGFDMNNWDPSLDKNGLSFWDMFENSTSFYNSPSMDLRRIFQLAMLSTNPIQPDRNFSKDPVYVNPLQQRNPCPSNSDCTFSISFFAPSYQCEEREEFGGQQLYNRSQLAPYGDLLYASYSSIPEDVGGRPLDWDVDNPNNDTGVFKQEPTLWIGYTWNTTLPPTAENATQWNTSYWESQYNAHILECTLRNATYHITLGFYSSLMQVLGADYRVEYGPPLLSSGQVSSPIMPNYMEFAGFHASGVLYRNLLAGNVSQPGDQNGAWATTNSDISETDITDPGTGMPHEEALGPYIEAGFQSIYLAMLSDEKQASQFAELTPCDVQATVLVWRYTPLWLAISYGIAVGLTVVAVGVGLYAMAVNGYVARTTFSTFLATTRNADLDSVVRGSSLGTLPLNKEVSETVLRFGESVRAWDATGNDAVAHATFGFPEQIRTIKRGKKYA